MLENFRILYGCHWLVHLPHRYINVFLKKVAQGGMIIYSPSRKAFYSRKQGTQAIAFKAENYTDITGEWLSTELCSIVPCDKGLFLHIKLTKYDFVVFIRDAAIIGSAYRYRLIGLILKYQYRF